VEGTKNGLSRLNREYNRNTAVDPNLIKVQIEGWEKLAAYTFIIKKMPKKTPHDASIFITGNFCKWEPANPLYQLKRGIDGYYQTLVYSDLERLEYKFTRGNWESVESKASGKTRGNRILYRKERFDHKNIAIEVEGWEDLTGTFHFFSLYDLLLLFSVFQGILLIIAIPTIHDYNQAANRWLFLTMGITSVVLLLKVLSTYQEAVQSFAKFLLFPDFILFAYGPLFYFYLQKLLFNIKGLPSRWQLHFLPFVAQFFVYLPFLLMRDSSLQIKMLNHSWDLQVTIGVCLFLAFFWNVYYWWLFYRSIRFYKEEYKTHFSYEQNLVYLNTVLLVLAACLALGLFVMLTFCIGYCVNADVSIIIERGIGAIWLAFSTITYLIGYFAIHQPEIFKVAPHSFSIFDDVLETSIGNKATINTKKSNELPDENIQEWKKKVEDFMAKSKPYTNPGLSLAELAAELKMPTHILSKVLNEGFEKNFFDFVNGYRIEEFKLRVENPQFQHLTLLGIAYDVGFNSKTAFNRSFKKITGMTPRDYFNPVQQN
jgi:AraC-like DNA-binding protein